jgi:sensor histidine kinase YesM
MLMEIFCGYMIMQFFDNYMEHQMLGSFISKGLMLLIIISLRKVFSDEDIRDLPVKYNILLMLIPIGSIFVVNNMFKLSNLTGKGINNFWSVISSFIMLLINVIIFNLYLKIADELELKRIATVYKQQLELYERHQHERELSMLQFRNMKHNMKNNLIAIMAYAQNQECNKIMEYVEEIMEEKCVSTTDISNTGNIVVDSLINYWSSIANKSGVDFQTNVSIPIQIPFRGADVCLILGNALENAFEAVNKLTDSKKYIKLNMMYDKGNLLISILNTYNGITIKDREGELKSTKGDADNHGIGLKSIYHTAKRYHGVVVIKNNGKEFIIKVLLYKTE